MATYETLDDILDNVPEFEFNLTSGNSVDGYFNSADWSDPPKIATECEGGSEISFNIDFDRSAESLWLREVIMDNKHFVLHDGGNVQYSAHQTEVITASEGVKYVRIGACIESIQVYRTEVSLEPTFPNEYSEGLLTFEVKVKIITTTGLKFEQPVVIHAIASSSSYGEYLDPDPEVEGGWKITRYWDDPVSKQYDGTLFAGAGDLNSPDLARITDTLDLKLGIPFFHDEEALDDYLENGVMTDPDPITPEGTHKFYIETYTYKNTVPKEDSMELISHRRQEFNGDDTFLMKRWYLEDKVLPNNMKWGYEGKWFDAREIEYNLEGGASRTDTFIERDGDTLLMLINPWHCGEEWHESDLGFWYKSRMITNIALVGDESDDPKPPKPDPDDPNPTGDDDPNTILPDPTLECVGSHVYLLNKEGCVEFLQGLFDDTPSVVEGLKKGLEMYGSDPLQCICDFYATPLDIRAFCDVSSQSHVVLGSYGIPVSGCYNVSGNTKKVTIGQCAIKGTYNDWRDYDAKYYMYLPYIGFTVLDTKKYINRVITLKVALDVRTGNIKYYVFSDGNVLETFEGCVHIACPLTADNMSSIPNRLVNASQNLVNGMVQMASSYGSNFGTAMNANLEFHNMQGVQARVSGNSSSNTALYDCNYPYIIIEQPEYIYPPTLFDQYGLPDDSINKLNNYKGYVKCSECELNITATTEEIDEIESLLRSGVYI